MNIVLNTSPIISMDSHAGAWEPEIKQDYLK
jgi:hypothetical protein